MNIGTIFFSGYPKGLLATGIQWCGTEKGEPLSIVCHTGAGSAPGRIIHTTWPRVTEEDWEPYRLRVEKEGGWWETWSRIAPVTDAEREKARTWLESRRTVRFLGRRIPRYYSVPEIVFQAMDRTFGKLTGTPCFTFRQFGKLLPNGVCSGMVGEFMLHMRWATEWIRNGPIWAADPDDVRDYLIAEHAHMGWLRAAQSANWPTDDPLGV